MRKIRGMTTEEIERELENLIETHGEAFHRITNLRNELNAIKNIADLRIKAQKV